MNQDNPFGTEHRKKVIQELMDQGLVKRITIIEGNYPSQKQQQDFIERIMEWLRGNRKHY
jgi:hypothetical protein